MPVYFSEEIAANNIRLGNRLLYADKLERNLNRLKAALAHAVFTLEVARRYGPKDQVALIVTDVEMYRRIMEEVEKDLMQS